MSEEQQQAIPAQVPASDDPQTLFNQTLTAAEQGQPEAMLTVGELYERGAGTAKNFTMALTWYEKAAGAGSGEAAFRTGLCHEIGIGTTTDMTKAIAAYNKSVELGSARAAHKMAMLYLSGYGQSNGLARDVSKGLELLKQAAKAGEGAAYNTIAMIFLHGQFGQPADRDKAMKSFTISAKAGNLEGMKNLALLLADEQPLTALRWALIAHRGGLRAVELTELTNSLHNKIDEAGRRQAEEEARQWISGYLDKKQGNMAPGGQSDIQSP